MRVPAERIYRHRKPLGEFYRWMILSWLLALCFVNAGQRGLPATNGIGNFGIVDERIYRGAQPDAAALRRLKDLGVKSIINLRMPGGVSEREEALARSNGLVYTNLPLRGVGRPKHEQVQRILRAMETLPGPVFVHCQHGCDRTGTIIACYRIAHDNWSAERALKEAKQYGLSGWARGMKHFVLDYGKTPKLKSVPVRS